MKLLRFNLWPKEIDKKYDKNNKNLIFLLFCYMFKRSNITLFVY